MYTWVFWDWRSRASGVEPDYTVEQAQLITSFQITQWVSEGKNWAKPLLYLVAINRVSEPALAAKLKCHLP